MNVQKVIDYFIEHEGKYLVVEEKVKLLESFCDIGLLHLIFEYNEQRLIIPISINFNHFIMEVPENLFSTKIIYIDSTKTLASVLTLVLNNWIKRTEYSVPLVWSEE